MTKLILPAFAALAIFCGEASVNAQYPQQECNHHGYQSQNQQNYGSQYNSGWYGYQSNYQSSGRHGGPQSQSNYYGSQNGYYGQSQYASPYASPYQSSYPNWQPSYYLPRGY